MRLSGAPVPALAESMVAVNVPLVYAARSARTALIAYSIGVLTFCMEPPWLRNSSELNMTRSTSRICPFGLPFSQAAMHCLINCPSGARFGSV